MLDRKEIINKAYHDCMVEMYAKAQPEADYDNLIEEYRTGKIGKDECIYDRHYLSMDEFLYIRDKYKEAYNMNPHWKDDIEVLEQYLNNGGLKDGYVPEQVDEDGFKHPGYRSAEDVPPLKEQFEKVMAEFDMSEAAKNVADNLADLVMENIKNCKEFYRFDREEEIFDYNIALGASPCCNAETVKKWWKDNYNVDIEIEERNPKLFWYRDNEYTDEDLAEEFESENWKEIVDKEWQEEKEAEKKKHEEVIAEMEKKYLIYNTNEK